MNDSGNSKNARGATIRMINSSLNSRYCNFRSVLLPDNCAPPTTLDKYSVPARKDWTLSGISQRRRLELVQIRRTHLMAGPLVLQYDVNFLNLSIQLEIVIAFPMKSKTAEFAR